MFLSESRTFSLRKKVPSPLFRALGREEELRRRIRYPGMGKQSARIPKGLNGAGDAVLGVHRRRGGPYVG